MRGLEDWRTLPSLASSPGIVESLEAGITLLTILQHTCEDLLRNLVRGHRRRERTYFVSALTRHQAGVTRDSNIVTLRSLDGDPESICIEQLPNPMCS